MSHILGCSWTPNVNLAPFQILWECEQFSGLKRPSSRGRGEGTWNFSFSSSGSLCWIPPGLGVCGGFYQFSRCCAPRLWGSAFPQTTATSSRQALGDFVVFLCLGEAPSHPLQPAVQHFLKDCPPVLRLLCPAGSLEVSHMHTFFFFFMSHLLSVSPFPVPPIVLYYLFPIPLCVFIPILCLLKTSLPAQKPVFEFKWGLRKLGEPKAALQHTLAHL